MTDKEPTDRELSYANQGMELLKTFGVYDLIVGDSLIHKDLSGGPLTTYMVNNTVTGVVEYDGVDFCMAHDICLHLEGAWAEVMTAKSAIMTPPDKKLVLH